MKAAIVALAGPELLPDEARLLRDSPPAGIILFRRNIPGPAALARLVGDLREILPTQTQFMVDQEGGRVARLGPPGWRAHPSAARIGGAYVAEPEAALRLAWVTGALIGLDCREAGFDLVCAPVLDVLAPGATDAIGDRSYGDDPRTVAALGQAMADGLLAAGVQPVGKHAPGHGRATVDSHIGLPRLAATADLVPEIAAFTACNGLPWMMTAHIVYDALDPHRPGTLSPIVIEGVIRGTIGFDGVLVSDDLAMGALSGTAGQRSAAALAAGCDLALHCSGRIAETRDVLHAVPDLPETTARRLHRARREAEDAYIPLDRITLEAEQDALLAALPEIAPESLAEAPRDPTVAPPNG